MEIMGQYITFNWYSVEKEGNLSVNQIRENLDLSSLLFPTSVLYTGRLVLLITNCNVRFSDGDFPAGWGHLFLPELND
jgi:hypothetical protein